jgi:HD-GYP domain-containing protein (c-di-GMP phosphodiesterase class II)
VASALASEGEIVGRYGGDEFLVVLPGADRAEADAFVQRAVRDIREAKVVDDATSALIRLPVSMGIAVYPEEAGTLVDLIKASDSAMYAAKSKRALEEGEVARRLDDRVSGMIADLVPLLTSPGVLEEKLKLVASRLSTGTGYDAVDCQIYRTSGDSAQSALREGETDALTERWAEEQRVQHEEPREITKILTATRRPIILEDLASDERLTEVERTVLGAAGLQSALVSPMLWDGELIGTVAVARKAKAAFDPRDAQFLAAVANQVSAIVRMATLVDGLQQATERLSGAQAETVMMLAAAAEAHDHTTGLHLASIRALAEAIAEELGYDGERVRELGLAATLHDIGKISVPDSILSSPVRFDSDEREIAGCGT